MIEVYGWNSPEASSILIILDIVDESDEYRHAYTNIGKSVVVYDLEREEISQGYSLESIEKWIKREEAVILFDNV